jgi:hypothetical protein
LIGFIDGSLSLWFDRQVLSHTHTTLKSELRLAESVGATFNETEILFVTYVWKCNTCDDRVEIVRSMAESEDQPNANEHYHVSMLAGFTKVIVNGSMVHVHENEAQYR